MTELESYQGKLALVTGADGGIGEMLAKGLAATGPQVCATQLGRLAKRVANEIGCTAYRSAVERCCGTDTVM